MKVLKFQLTRCVPNIGFGLLHTLCRAVLIKTLKCQLCEAGVIIVYILVEKETEVERV